MLTSTEPTEEAFAASAPDSATPEVSVVVPTHNRPDGLAGLLDGLRAQTFARERFEVIVVDDGSEPGQVIDGDGLPLRVVRHEASRGPAAARNSGWKAARAPLVAFIDDDCTPTPGWLSAFVDAADGADDSLIIQGPVVPAPDQRADLTPLSHTIDFPGPHPLFVTCNIAYSRALLERVGGFDETFRNACGEDVELGTRAIKAGGEARYTEGAEVHHEVRQLGLRGLARQTFKWTDAVKVLSVHPELREMLVARTFWKPTHPLLLLAFAGLASRRPLLAAAAAAPYLEHYRRVYRRSSRQLARSLPVHLVIDVCEVGTMVAGSIRHRSLML